MSKLAIYILTFYRRWISPGFPPTCRFYPSCSRYTIQAIEKHGFMRGTFYGIKRLVRCHPFHPGGFDPVP